jgi:hypothetical protein
VGAGALDVGLRWGLLACVGFAGLALPIVLLFLRDEKAGEELGA